MTIPPTTARRRPIVVLGGAGIIVLLVTATACRQPTPTDSTTPAGGGLHLTAVTTVPLPGDTSRLDYTSLDPAAHRLFIAHLGASQIIEIDTTTNQVVNVIDNIPGVHGVLVVPDLHRVFATATTSNKVLTLNEDTGTVLSRAPTGDYPDGLAYEPTTKRVWVTNETGGTETVLDTTTGQIVGTVDVGGDAGNVAYDPAGRILVAVQSRNQVVVIDPTTLTITQRVDIPGCDHPHGLTLNPDHRVGFVACDGNATLHTLDLDTYQTNNPLPVGDNPDVLAYDPGQQRLYVAAESGTITVLAETNRQLTVLGRDHLADGAQVVAVDPTTHRTYYPIASGSAAQPELLVEAPTPGP
jgi:DNA-binding beta-propeller fold protein YncE